MPELEAREYLASLAYPALSPRILALVELPPSSPPFPGEASWTPDENSGTPEGITAEPQAMDTYNAPNAGVGDIWTSLCTLRLCTIY